MKNDNQNIKDIIFLILLVISFTFLINPFGIIMTDDFEMVLLGIISLVVITLLIFLWKEDPVDERDEAHLLLAGRFSFFSTALTLLVALIVQTFQHNIDVWVPIILAVLLSSKILSVIYFKYKK